VCESAVLGRTPKGELRRVSADQKRKKGLKKAKRKKKETYVHRREKKTHLEQKGGRGEGSSKLTTEGWR